MSKIKENIKETKTNLAMSWHFIKKRKSNLIFITILSIFLSLISVITPILSAKLLLKLSNGELNELLKVSIFIFIVEMSRNIINFIFNKISQKYIINTLNEIQLEMFSETLKITTSCLDKNSSGTFIDRIKNDTSDIINIFSEIISIFIDFISNIGIFIACLYINKYMFIYFIITSIILGYISKKERDIYFEGSKKYRLVREKSTGLAAEFIRGIRDVKLLNGTKGIMDQTKKELDKVKQEKISMENKRYHFRILANSIRDFLDVSFIILGICLVKYSNLTIANFVILYMYRGHIEGILRTYDSLVELIKSYNLSATRVFEVLGDHFPKEKEEGLLLEHLDGNIEFRNVSFSYAEEEVIKNINLNIKKGERIGFVGTSGSGKSTIFNLITKLYNQEKGEILIDGINIKDISYTSVRNNISLIPQSPYIFNFSILDNLRLANPSASINSIIEACKKADIYKKIESLDNKFDTEVGEGGVILSGGEKQRLAIARSLIKNTNIILFDEATSSLDNISQDKVQNSIYKLDKDKTILIIAHRLSTVINCDRIVVMDKGKILDIGSHKELLDRCKKYQELFKYEEIKEEL